MQNLEQIRAAKALGAANGLSRSAVNKLPALILQSGLLATAAFCETDSGGEKNRQGMKLALAATAEHLAERGLLAQGTNSTRGMVEELSRRDSHHLQSATSEALSFIAYLKRFARND
jgi:CRISPR type III-B/RAMP module-associated protein Cmr5